MTLGVSGLVLDGSRALLQSKTLCSSVLYGNLQITKLHSEEEKKNRRVKTVHAELSINISRLISMKLYQGTNRSNLDVFCLTDLTNPTEITGSEGRMLK